MERPFSPWQGLARGRRWPTGRMRGLLSKAACEKSPLTQRRKAFQMDTQMLKTQGGTSEPRERRPTGVQRAYGGPARLISRWSHPTNSNLKIRVKKFLTALQDHQSGTSHFSSLNCTLIAALNDKVP